MISAFVQGIFAGIGMYFLVVIIHPDYKVYIRPNFMQGKYQWCPKKFLDEICWGKSLNELNRMKQDKDILKAKLVIGEFTYGDCEQSCKTDHVWIMYQTRKGEIWGYDPMKDERWRIKNEEMRILQKEF